jgi:hypothetical protein
MSRDGGGVRDVQRRSVRGISKASEDKSLKRLVAEEVRKGEGGERRSTCHESRNVDRRGVK